MTPNRLAGLTVVVTRSREQAGKLARALETLGARVIQFPTIAIRATDDPPPFHQHTHFDWTVFTSANAVNFFARKVKDAGFTIEKLQLGRVCAVGSATKSALDRNGVKTEPLPEEFVAESVFDYVHEQDPTIAKKRVLLPRGNIARDMLLFAFRSAGATVTPWTVYVNEAVRHSPEEIARPIAAKPDLVTFTRASTAKNFCPAHADRLAEFTTTYASIGPLTTEAAVSNGLQITIQPRQHDIPSLVEAIAEWASTRTPR